MTLDSVSQVYQYALQLYIQQANVAMQDYIFGVWMVILIGLWIVGLFVVNYKFFERSQYDGGFYFALFGAFCLWFLFGVCMYIGGGYNEYCTAKMNPEYWATEKMLRIFTHF